MNGNGVIDDKHNISIEDVSITEGETKAITITRSSREPISVRISSSSVGSGYNIRPTEASGDDFVFANNAIIEFGNSSSSSFEVQAIDDSSWEWNETFQIYVSVINSTSSSTHYTKRYSTVTILDNDSRPRSTSQASTSNSNSTASSTTSTSTTGVGYGVTTSTPSPTTSTSTTGIGYGVTTSSSSSTTSTSTTGIGYGVTTSSSSSTTSTPASVQTSSGYGYSIQELANQIDWESISVEIDTSYELTGVKDYDGNLHGGFSFSQSAAYKFKGEVDLDSDGTNEKIFISKQSGRWVSLSSSHGILDYSDFDSKGRTRVLGIYEDPLVLSGIVEKGSPFDSQTRFQNDLYKDNLRLGSSADVDNDSFTEVFWATQDGTAYLRSIHHADGNIKYANYMNAGQITDYLSMHGHFNNIGSSLGL